MIAVGSVRPLTRGMEKDWHATTPPAPCPLRGEVHPAKELLESGIGAQALKPGTELRPLAG